MSKTLEQAASYFGKLALGGYKANLAPALTVIGAAVKHECEKEIGEYQGAIGGYPATAPLSPDTIDRKTKKGLGKGGDADSPLWETGKYHDSIETAQDLIALEVEIGTRVDYVKYQELGTSHIPPRPIFGPSTLRAIPPLLPVLAELGTLAVAGGMLSGLAADAVTKVAGKETASLIP